LAVIDTGSGRFLAAIISLVARLAARRYDAATDMRRKQRIVRILIREIIDDIRR
jgi:hypothetical protein